MKGSRLATVFALCGFVYSAVAADVKVQLTEISVDGKVKVEYLVSKAVLAKQPRWDERKGDAPLSQTEVIRLARAELQRRGVVVSSVQLRDVSVSRVDTAGLSNIWYYTASFSPITCGAGRAYWDCKVLLLMDGSVVNATPVGQR
jgi:hypothetical protein